VQRAGNHRRDHLVTTENLARLLPPGRPLLGQRAGFVFHVPGLQRGPLRQFDGFDGGGAWSAWNWVASSPVRASIAARRVDQRWFSQGSAVTMSRIGRFRGSGFGRSGNLTASRWVSWASRACVARYPITSAAEICLGEAVCQAWSR
jgi:hypothetical protein